MSRIIHEKEFFTGERVSGGGRADGCPRFLSRTRERERTRAMRCRRGSGGASARKNARGQQPFRVGRRQPTSEARGRTVRRTRRCLVLPFAGRAQTRARG